MKIYSYEQCTEDLIFCAEKKHILIRILKKVLESAKEQYLPRTRSVSGVKWSVVVSILLYYVCGRKKYLNRTLEIDSPFQTLTVELLVEFID